MLKSYNELSRWYSALEPETEAADPARQDTADPAAGEDDGPARYSQRPERAPSAAPAAELTGPVPPPAVAAEPSRTPGDEDRDDYYGVAGDHDRPVHQARPYPVDVAPEPPPAPPAELAARRSEFTGGWSDWVAGPAPGPDDEYDAELVQFPWTDAADDEYDEARVLEPSGSLRGRNRNRTWIVLAVSVLVLVLAATGVFFLLFGRGGDTAKHAAPPLHFTAGNLTAETVGQCPTENTGAVVRSAEAGGTGSGPDAVLAFQYAYYVNRSGEQARAVVTPDADVSPAAVIQRGIDSIPVGTTHCVRITTVAADRFTVEVTEFRPAGAPATYTKQSVRTALVGDRTLITGIAAG
ncbi:hypothetical protein [Nocardia sp. NPDC051833]|uniref:hypothetical protein n=1 Tax=Nocardia sp. NPDC051833 TaxID=3155674 RepID=UPI0034271A64